MDAFEDKFSHLLETIYGLQDLLSSKSVRLAPAAAEDLQTSLDRMYGELEGYLRQLRERRLDDSRYLQLASIVAEPYEPREVVPLKGGGVLVIAEPSQPGLWTDAPKTELDESPEHIDVITYLDTDDDDTINQVLTSIDNLVEVLGYEQGDDVEIERGSIFRRASATARQAADELKSRLAKAERALELAQLELRQAEVDAKEAQAVNALIISLQSTPRACMRVGSVLLVKYSINGEPVIIVRNLTQLELHALGRFPEIQKHPEQALDALATAILSMSENPNELSGGEYGSSTTAS
jgi:hypothetical protein